MQGAPDGGKLEGYIWQTDPCHGILLRQCFTFF